MTPQSPDPLCSRDVPFMKLLESAGDAVWFYINQHKSIENSPFFLLKI